MVRKGSHRLVLLLMLSLIAAMFAGAGIANASADYINVNTAYRYVNAGEDRQKVGDISIDWADPEAKHPYDIGAYPDARIQVIITITTDGVVFSDNGTNEKTITLPGDEDPLPVVISGDELMVDVDEGVSGSINANVRVYYSVKGEYLIDESFGDKVDVADGKDVTAETGQGSTAAVTPATTAIYVIGAPAFTVNGETQMVVNPSYIKDGRTYLAIRDIATGLSIDPADIKWDEANQAVTLTKGNKVVKVQIGSNILNINGEQSVMDVVPELNNSRCMLPAAFVARAFGATASMDANTNTVTIK